MKLKLLLTTLLAGALLAVAPVWAHGGHGHGYDHGHGYGKHWKKYDRYQYRSHPRRAYRDRVVVREYVERVPVYQDYPVSAPAAGVHIVTPDLFIPWPR